jgi:signal transduction histidine kinase
VPLFGEQGEVKGVIEIALNITARKRAEEDLKRLNKQLREEHRKRKLLSKRLIQLLEMHNRKISMDLHDHIGQSLVTIKMDLDMILDRAAKTDKTLTALVEKAQTKTVKTIEDVEKIAYGLRPSMIDNLGLIPSLRDLFKELQDHTKLKIHFFNRGIPKRFDAEKELVIFRVAQEAVCNVLKHSQAENCFVNLVTKGNSIALSVEDDGIGFEPKEKKCPPTKQVTLGLAFMQERVVQMKGNFKVESRAGSGVHLVARIPL